jgi:aryl-alcohol dehydrogenase-like predicted oxidoreductase
MATPLSVGAMNFGKRTPPAESDRIVRRALERGVTFFDTANAYSDGESERILGKALRTAAARDKCVVASKVGMAKVNGKPEGLSAAAIARAIDGTLERLGTGHVDLYYLHVPDHGTPIEETLGAVHALLDARKIRAWGVSNYASWQILEMMSLCDARKMPRPVWSQVLYNMLIRQIEIEHLAFAQKYGVKVAVYNPLAGGLLTGKYGEHPAIAKGSRFDNNPMYQRRYWSQPMFERKTELEAIAKEAGLSMVELAYAWTASRPGVSSILVGPASIEQLDAAIDACEKTVPQEILTRIDATYRAWMGTDTNYVR